MRADRIIHLGRYLGREAAALTAGGQLDDLLIEAPAGRPIPGAIYRGVASRPMKGQGGLIVSLPEFNGFVRQVRGVAPGQPLLVQIAGYAEAHKAAPVTLRLSLKGRSVIVTPGAPGRNVSRSIESPGERDRLGAIADRVPLPEDTGLIIRSAATRFAEEDVAEEAARLAQEAALVTAEGSGGPALLRPASGPHESALIDWDADRIDQRDDAFDEGLVEQIEALRSPEVDLAGGARMTIEPTRALVAIDVDTGRDTSPAAALKANLQAARALPRALRCRGLGGQITVDFAPMPKRDRQRLEQALNAAFRSDPIATTVAGWTPLSHVELQRQRLRLPISEILA